MRKIKISLCLWMILSISCSEKKTEKNIDKVYSEHIGNTVFNPKKDDPNFKFCDSSEVHHSKSKIGYRGGVRAIEREFLDNYIFEEQFQDFSGSFIIRFGLNCNYETGRFRWEILDRELKETFCPEKMENHVISIVRKLEGWEHLRIDNNQPQGYGYIKLNFEKGKLILS
ncbi:hypothetical protein [Aureivirga sp. CE67]|uniref:hypothetical protein n=1 Tax=Aureivirga sp. CE67 TaxID=1788983 RepID=UPI0018CB47E0|nr:hypothetical protein [Aureivirga sp. CE67]